MIIFLAKSTLSEKKSIALLEGVTVSLHITIL